MTETVFVRGAGGALFEMDVPTAGHALERYEEAIRKGDLSVVPHAEWVTRPDGSRHLVIPEPAEAPAAKPKKQKPEASAEDAPVDIPEEG